MKIFRQIAVSVAGMIMHKTGKNIVGLHFRRELESSKHRASPQYDTLINNLGRQCEYHVILD